VPFCLNGGTASATGTGTDLTPLDMPRPWWVVLVSPDVVVPTAEVYRRLDARGFDPQHDRFEKAIESVQAGDLAAVLYNSMEPVVLDAYPRVRSARNAFTAAGAANVLMSGSGATVYALTETEDDARHLASRIPPHPNHRTIVCPTA
jgi:4-diphosphocytidyl-2-C-methyl-D-erythritol kinase